jgi:hypothetical protein
MVWYRGKTNVHFRRYLPMGSLRLPVRRQRPLRHDALRRRRQCCARHLRLHDRAHYLCFTTGLQILKLRAIGGTERTHVITVCGPHPPHQATACRDGGSTAGMRAESWLRN